MKRSVLITALVSLLLFAVTACGSATATEGALPALKTGRYYLDGDETTGVYIELTDDSIYMGGDNLYEFWEADYRKMLPEVTDEEEISLNVTDMVEHYSAKAAYNFTSFKFDEEVTYAIFYSSDRDAIDKNTATGSYYKYNPDGTISPGPENCYFSLTK